MLNSNLLLDFVYLFALSGTKDIVVVTDHDVKEHGANPYLIVRTALEEEKEIYRAAS